MQGVWNVSMLQRENVFEVLVEQWKFIEMPTEKVVIRFINNTICTNLSTYIKFASIFSISSYLQQTYSGFIRKNLCCFCSMIGTDTEHVLEM